MVPLQATLIVLLVVTSSAAPPGVPIRASSQRLTQPTLLVVDSAEGLLSSRLQPGRFYPVEDPTNSLICKHLQSDYTAYYFPQPLVPFVKQRLLSESIRLDETIAGSMFSSESEGMPWVVFSRKSRPLLDVRGLHKVNLQLTTGALRFTLPVLSVYQSSDLGIDDLVDYPEDVLASPPPLFPSLCVSPEKPRPFPVLFSAPPTQTYPSVASFSFGDLNPSVISKQPAI